MYESISIIEQCLNGINKEKEGDITIKVKEIPEGIGNGRAEAPRGEVFHFVQSDGSNSPVRHKIRAPSYVNIATFKKSCIGQTIADATISLAAVDPCYCCTERMAVAYDLNSGEKIMNANDLINESVKKTNELKKTINNRL
jgi:NADH-quinone oxidoreductase subunit D